MRERHSLLPWNPHKCLTFGGERGIRTLDRILSYTPLAGARLRPLGHLSVYFKNLCFTCCCNRLRRVVAGDLRFIYDGFAVTTRHLSGISQLQLLVLRSEKRRQEYHRRPYQAG